MGKPHGEIQLFETKEHRFKEKMLAQGPWRMFKKSGPGPFKHHAPLAEISRDKRIFLTVPTLSIPSISGSAVSL